METYQSLEIVSNPLSAVCQWVIFSVPLISIPSSYGSFRTIVRIQTSQQWKCPTSADQTLGVLKIYYERTVVEYAANEV